MQLTWQIHACIRIEQDGVTIVVSFDGLISDTSPVPAPRVVARPGLA